MSRPKPGMGRELRRTLGQAKVHSHTASSVSGAIQLAPIVSQYAASARASSSTSYSQEAIEAIPTASSSSSTSTGLVSQFSHLSLIPQWDSPTAYFDPFAPVGALRDEIVSSYPYRPARRISPLPLPRPLPRAPIVLAPRPIRLTESLRQPSRHRHYTSSSTPVRNANTNATMEMPFPGLTIPPSILSDTFSFTSGDTQSTWSFWTPFQSQQTQAGEPEMGLVPQQPPSPGPGTVKMRKTAEHTVFSPSTPAHTQNMSSSHALLNHYVASFPDLRDANTLPIPPDSTESTIYSSSLEFRIGASGLAKVRPPPTPPRTSSSSRERPPPPRTFPIVDIKAPSKLLSEQVGEDAYFTRPDSMCIADGVGGWARSGKGGANAARWSRLLTHFIREEVDLWWKGDPIYVEPASDAKKKGKKSWSETWRDSKTKEDDGLGLDEGLKRRTLDAVEIMQRGFEKCLSCVMSEVSYAVQVSRATS
jgi:protein phosphatase PTC7